MSPSSPARAPAAPSRWVQRFAALIAPGARVLDVACGSGRHLRWLAERGLSVTGVDRDAESTAPLHALGEIVVADIESSPWPFAGRRFDAVVVTNYLWRPLLPTLVTSLADGGLLIYETFADGQQTIGRPSRPEFLLQPGELLMACAGLHIVAYEHGLDIEPERCVQRIAAVRVPVLPARHRLDGSPTAPPGPPPGSERADR